MGAPRIHPTAIIAPQAELGADVEIGPYAIVGPGVTLGPRCRIGSHAVIERNSRLGAECRVGTGSVIGGDPQDLKYAGEETWVEIGDGSVLREYVTVNRGTAATGRTSVGARCFLMSYVHVAHDCHLGEEVIVANAVQMAGHVTIGARAFVSGLTPIHQFVRIGTHAFIGGGSRVTKDVPPYTKAVGNPLRLYGLNAVGLRRHGFPEATLRELKRAYRHFFASDLNVAQALARAREELAPLSEVETFIAFVEASQRGVLV